MGFNYLQTDDRDDYFSQFDKKKKRKPTSFTLINPDGAVVLSEVASYVIRRYGKRNVFTPGQNGKHVWRKLLEAEGYKVVNNFN